MTPANLDRSEFSRRDVLRMSGGAALGVAGISALPAVATATPAASPGVDFSIRFASTVITKVDPLVASVPVTVANVGTADSRTDVRVVAITPFWINYKEGGLPEGATYVVRDPSPNVPEMITFTVPAERLTAGASVDFALGIEPVPNGPQVYDQFDGIAIAMTGTEAELINNQAAGTVGLPMRPPRSQPRHANAVNPFFVYTQPVMKTGCPTPLTIQVGNASKNSAKADGTFTLVTPYNVKVDRDDGAFKRLNPTYHHHETHPCMPDMVTIPVPRASLAAGRTDTMTIPLIAHSGGYSNRSGRGFLATGQGDYDTRLAVAISRISIIQPC